MFNEIIRLIQNGELVTAAITNRAPRQNDQNIRILRDLFEAAMLGETVFARNRTVEIDAQVGMAVYFNPVTQQFERARGSVELNSQNVFQTTISSQVWGIVSRKLSSTLADILLNGTLSLDMSAAIVTPTPGTLYYLSNNVPGQLEDQRPPVGVTVLQTGQANGDGTHVVYVNTKFHDLLEAHRHYKFTLVSVPAGVVSPPDVGNRHTISSADTDVEGWLPADHASFNNLAPTGAKFGYNLPASPLRHLWPPLPVEAAYLEWNKGDSTQRLGMGVPLGEDGLCIMDRNGIWWLTDCYDQVPWATNFDSATSVSTSSSLSTSVSADLCPHETSPKMVLWFTKPVFQTTGSSVLSLTPKANSGLIITCVDTGELARAGHLLIDLDLALRITSDDAMGHLVFKELNTDGSIKRGPVVSSISAGSDNVSLTSNIAPSADGRYVGNVKVHVSLEIDGREISVDTVRLDSVEQEFYEDVIALGFRAGIAASFRGRLNIPADLPLPTGTKIKLRFWFLNRSSLTVPAQLFSMSYRRLPIPTALATPRALPTSSLEHTLASLPATNIAVSTANQYFMVDSAAFSILAGDTIMFTLARRGDLDGFNGNLHLLRQQGRYITP